MNCCQHKIDQKDEQVFHEDIKLAKLSLKVFLSANEKFPTAEKLPAVWSNSLWFVIRLPIEALKYVVFRRIFELTDKRQIFL